MIQVQYLKPFYTKVTGNKLRLVFVFQFLSILKDGEIYHFIPIEGKEMIIDLQTQQIENTSEVFVFQKGNRFIRLPLYQFSLISDIYNFINPIIHKEIKNNPKLRGLKVPTYKIAKVNFKGLSDLPTREKTYYFRTYIDDLKINDIVWVDSQNKQQRANFLGYIDEYEIDFKPTKYIISKVNATEVAGQDDFTVDVQESRKCEYSIPDKFKQETIKLISEIIQFNKDNYKEDLINKYLDNRDFDGLEEYLNNQVQY